MAVEDWRRVAEASTRSPTLRCSKSPSGQKLPINQVRTLRLSAEVTIPKTKIATDTPQITLTLTIKICTASPQFPQPGYGGIRVPIMAGDSRDRLFLYIITRKTRAVRPNRRLIPAAGRRCRCALRASCSCCCRAVLRSSTVALLHHLATVLGLIPNSGLSVASEACDCCIVARTACVVVALP